MKERHNGVSKSTLNRVCKDSSVNADHNPRVSTAVCLTSFAENAFLGLHVYSPFMAVFGQEVCTMSRFKNESATLAKNHLNNIQKMKQAYLLSENDERIKAGMRRTADPQQPPIRVKSVKFMERSPV